MVQTGYRQRGGLLAISYGSKNSTSFAVLTKLLLTMLYFVSAGNSVAVVAAKVAVQSENSIATVNHNSLPDWRQQQQQEQVEEQNKIEQGKIRKKKKATNFERTTTSRIAQEAPSEFPHLVEHYKLWESQQIRETLLQWGLQYPNFLRVTTAQHEYGIPGAGTATDCPFDTEMDGCLNYVLTVQDYVIHPEGSASSNALPEVLWSGELHGDERVGPTAVLEATRLLLLAATCTSHPRRSNNNNNAKAADIDEDLESERGRDCRRDLENFAGVSEKQLNWLSRLVTTRRIVIVPTANALGYYRHNREEGSIDANRDFPFDVTDPKECMQSIAARALNEIFRDHLFQLSLTFHGGDQLIGYEWGAPTYENANSPDDSAQAQIAQAYSRFAGGWGDVEPYKTGDMNTIIYGVRGGMEDWAYAGSWDPERVVQCNPTTYGGYAAEKTVYNNSTLRVFNMLVETSYAKTPGQSALGTSQDLLSPTSPGNGHVVRNLRLALAAADLVEPYVAFATVNDLDLSDDTIPLEPRGEKGEKCQNRMVVTVPKNKDSISLKWNVGGAIHIDSTTLWYAKWNSIPEDMLDCLNQPNSADIAKHMYASSPSSATSGWGPLAEETVQPTQPFVATVDLKQINQLKPGDKLVVIASAQVDQDWVQQPKSQKGWEVKPSLPPQSHIVNVRNDPTWHHESNGKVVRGRRDWFSLPLTIEIGDYEHVGGDDSAYTFELTNRFGIQSKSGSMVPPDRLHQGSNTVKNIAVTFLVVAVALAFVLLGRYYMQYHIRVENRQRVRTEIIDGDDDGDGHHGAMEGAVDSQYKDDTSMDPIPGEDVHENGVEMRRYID